MMHTKSESDVTSLAASSPPRSPKRAEASAAAGASYYVQSPSRESHDGGYKSSSMQATPVFNSPNESPSHPSFGRHSRSSSVSRFSGKPAAAGGGGKGVNEKGWPECNVIEEEGSYEDMDGARGIPRRCQLALAFLCFVLLFTFFCLIIWGAARASHPDIVVKSLDLDNFYAGEGTDNTGVPTKMVTLNCSMKLSVHNPASMYGIHLSSGPVRIIFSQITIASGQLNNYYQPRTSHRTVEVIVRGDKVPLYGAGAGLTLSATGSPAAVPLTLDFDITSRGYVIGELVKVTHRKHVSCSFTAGSGNAKPIRFSKRACSYA